jgi:putative ABC transport system permease protein
MESITKVIGREHQEDSRHGVLVRPLQEWMVGDVRRMFLTLVGAVLFVLLICCANIANLLMARAAARQREMAIRASLGAGRLRLLRQALIESLLLALIGGTLGFGLAVAIVRAVPAIHAFRIPRVEEVALDYSVFLIAAAVTLASGILFGLAPAFQAGRGDIGVSLYKGDAPALGRLGGHYFRNALVVAQIALALVLLAGAGLMTNSLVRLLRIDLGFARSNILTIGTSLLPRGYDQKRRAEFQRLLAAEVAGMPGVEQVGISDYPPLYAVLFPYYLRVKGSDTRQKVQAMARHVDPGYLRVTGIRLLAGRDLERADENRGPVPALINTTAARALFGTESPLGRQVTTGYRRPDVLEFVGVVGDAHQIELTSDPGPQIYLPLTYGHASYVLARVSPRSGELAAAIRAVVRRLEPEAPAPVISTVDAMFARQTAQPRFYLTLLGAFAALSVLLAAVGIYGVISYTVARRTHEFGVRMALGAGPSDILRLVLRTGIGLTAAGTVLGLAGALALTRLLASMLYGVRPNDPLTLGCVAVLLAGIALAACYLAARRATAVDPNVALKCE